MKKSALASVKSDRWRHLAPKNQTFGSIRVLKTGRFNFFSLHHYPQHKCGETLSPRCNGCVSMIQWWWARSSLSESRQPMEVKLEQLLRLQTTEGKRWNIETNLELSLISGPLNSVIAQTLWKSSVDLEYIYWDTATISCFWLLQYLKRFFTTLCIERGSFTGQYIRLLPSPGWTLPSCFPLIFSHPPPSPGQSAVLESSLQQTMACSISSAIGNNCAEYTQTTR